MPQEPSSSQEGTPDADDLPEIPRATELLLKLRKRPSRPSWGILIPCLLYLGVAVFQLATLGMKAFPEAAFWLGLAVLFLLGSKYDQFQKREKIVNELLTELVAENNRLRRQMASSATDKPQR